MHQDGLALRGPLGPMAGFFSGNRGRNSQNWELLQSAADVEFFDCALLQVMGNGRDAVGLFDGKFRDRQSSVVSDERNVRSMQRGDEGKSLGRGHHAREQSADGMGNRIMNVEQVKILRVRDLHRIDGQRKRVRRVIEQWVAGNFHFVKLNIRSFVSVRRMGGA